MWCPEPPVISSDDIPPFPLPPPTLQVESPLTTPPSSPGSGRGAAADEDESAVEERFRELGLGDDLSDSFSASRSIDMGLDDSLQCFLGDGSPEAFASLRYNDHSQLNAEIWASLEKLRKQEEAEIMWNEERKRLQSWGLISSNGPASSDETNLSTELEAGQPLEVSSEASDSVASSHSVKKRHFHSSPKHHRIA
jgi:hypothetical protein